MRRRDFIVAIGGAAAWPVGVRAQRSDRLRRIGVLVGVEENDEGQSYVTTFTQELARLGWVDRRNVQFLQRWGGGELDRTQAFAKELVQLECDVILAIGTAIGIATLQRETHTIPIVFTNISDPVGLGFVSGLPRPGGNITGFILTEGTLAGKWLQMMKEIAPHIQRAAAMYNPDSTPYARYFLGPFEAAARVLMVEPSIAEVRTEQEIESTIDLLGRDQGGLVFLPEVFTYVHLAAVIAATKRNKVPVIGPGLPAFTKDGGLMRYGPSMPVIFRQAAGYVDRILKGDKPADLPVQVPVKYELGINLKTAKEFGLTVPPTLLVFADELIE